VLPLEFRVWFLDEIDSGIVPQDLCHEKHLHSLFPLCWAQVLG
jgi:hypothetical protein